MSKLPRSIQNLIDNFARIPGVGPKSAARMAFFILHSNNEFAKKFSESITAVKESIKFCENCHNLSEAVLCNICEDESRDQSKIMVVEDVLDLLAFERTDQFQGVYHILGGVISPVQGIGPQELNIPSLRKRVEKIKSDLEIIIATSPNLEGEATAMFIKQEFFDNPKLKFTRIARGVPSGADLDYTDKLTLVKALTGRTNF